MKSAGEIMEILEAFDLTGSLRDAGELVKPGVGLTPTAGPAHSVGAGPFKCSDGRSGTIRFDGRYGVTPRQADCVSGGDGQGAFEIRLGRERTPLREPITGPFGGIATGVATGTFKGVRIEGRYTGVPTRGDCVTAPVTEFGIDLFLTLID